MREQIVDLTAELVRRPSVTPEDAGCQDLLARRLTAQGFAVTRLPFGPVANFWATRGAGSPILVFAGHTDVVPAGPVDAWRCDPFTPTVQGDTLYGRGSADMKGSLAAMVLATQRFVAANPGHRGTIAYLITSDEEGPAIQGTREVVSWLDRRDVRPHYCIVGEPSSSQRVGDVIRIGRRGSLSGTLVVRGVQGHVAYPHLASNPIHAALAALLDLTRHAWDHGNHAFPPTSLQISNLNSGTGAGNVIPGELTARFNLRYNTEQTAEGLKAMIGRMLDAHGLDCQLTWEHAGEPFLTTSPTLMDAVTDAVHAVQGLRPERSTAGGTSDGRFIARLGTEVVELGPLNASIHAVDEHTSISGLAALSDIYLGVLQRLLGADRG